MRCCCAAINYCDSNPCVSGATCMSSLSAKTYKCLCPAGLTGPTCASGRSALLILVCVLCCLWNLK